MSTRIWIGLLTVMIVPACTSPRGENDLETTAPSSAETPGARTTPSPFMHHRQRSLDYSGPGRDDPEPRDFKDVPIGWFGPGDPGHPLGGGAWLATGMAIEAANQDGGYHGRPFRLVPGWSENQWGSGVSRVTRMAYEDGVWAIIGSIDGPATHLAEQVVAKARLTLVNPFSTDVSVNLAGVSWMFSCAPGDHLAASLLVNDMLTNLETDDSFAVLRCTDHDSRLADSEITRALAKRNRGPERRLDFRPDTRDFTTPLDMLQELDPAALILVAGPVESARFMVALRGRGMKTRVFGTQRLGQHRFLELAGSAAEEVRFPLLFDAERDDQTLREFRRRFRERAGREPDYTAAFTFDATNLLIAAIRKAGLNRARIRDAMTSLSPWSGVTGQIDWDPTGQNSRPVTTMAVIRGGKVQVERRP